MAANINFELLVDLPPKVIRKDTLRISVNEKGMITMNGALKRSVGEQRKFKAQIYPDGSCFVLFKEREPDIEFSVKSANSLQHSFADLLKSKGYSFPVIYTLQWDEGHRAWGGFCSEISSAPGISEIKASVKKGRRAAK